MGKLNEVPISTGELVVPTEFLGLEATPDNIFYRITDYILALSTPRLLLHGVEDSLLRRL